MKIILIGPCNVYDILKQQDIQKLLISFEMA